MESQTVGSKKNIKKKHSGNHSGRSHFQNNFQNISQNIPAVSNRTVRYNPAQKVLSISMLVSGREETTYKSIDSLSRLRERVPSELILVDTGCPEEMHRELAKKADKIVKFTWCDDFSAARMAGLQKATGQWFMYMDDDEWFEDTGEIEDFFCSGEYLLYQSASYLQRNYLDLDGRGWRDMHVARMTKMRPQTRFFYPIHESLWPLLEPEKYFSAYVHHFGYADPDPEYQMAKRRRNLGLLLPTIEKDPHCMKHYLQAVAEYYAMEDYKSAQETADKGIANCDPSRVENAAHLDALHAAAVKMRLEQWHMEDAVQVGEDFLEHANINELSRTAIYGDLIFAYGELRQYDKCLDAATQYMKGKEFFDKNKDKLYRQDTLILDVTFEPSRYKKALGWAFAAALAVGDADKMESMLAEKPLDFWLNCVRDWYTLIAQPHREKWKQDFTAMMESLGEPNRAEGPRIIDQWDGRGGAHPCLWQIYEILTMPQEAMQAVEEAGLAEQLARAHRQAVEAAKARRQVVQVLGEAQPGHRGVGTGEVQPGHAGVKAEETGRPDVAARLVAQFEKASGRRTDASQSGETQMQTARQLSQEATWEQNPTGKAEGEISQSFQGKEEFDRGSDAGQAKTHQEADSGQVKAGSGRTTGVSQEMSVSQEMALLATQLKEKVRFLMKQGQYQAAHGVVMQLRGFFPGDPELMELQVLCESRL